MSATRALSCLTVVAGLAAALAAQEARPPARNPLAGFPDLVSALKESPGCLGVETARTASGKNVIFAWFENKQAVKAWYYSATHRQVMKMAGAGEPHEPMQGVPDDVGPVLAVASITMSDKPQFKDFPLPVSQISIELYRPVTGGIFLGSRFAPDALKVSGMKDLTPKP